MTTRIFVRAPYDQRVHADSRFWNASGIDVSVSADGVKIDTESVVSILIGGIAFDAPRARASEVAAAETRLPALRNRGDAEARHYTQSVA